MTDVHDPPDEGSNMDMAQVSEQPEGVEFDESIDGVTALDRAATERIAGGAGGATRTGSRREAAPKRESR